MKLQKWLNEELGAAYENNKLVFSSIQYILKDSVWTKTCLASEQQKQTEKVFGFKWNQEDTFNSATALDRTRTWLNEKYGNIEELFRTLPNNPLVLDAGCGAALSALELFSPVFSQMRYVGVDISEAIHVAAKRVHEAGFSGVFFQDDLCQLPFSPESIDCIFSEGVLHHTDNTQNALASLVPLLKKGGIIMFYVYKKKAVVREFTDDYIRERVQNLTPEVAWDQLKPLTQLGITLGELDIDIDVKEAIPLLDIPQGKLSLQRFFYWNICKMFYRPEMTFDEMHHINFDWFAPKNAYRQTPEEVSQWCKDLGLTIEHMKIEEAGITVVARK